MMKLKDYMDLMPPGEEVTCWDSVIDSEFYLYAKEENQNPEFPAFEKCINNLIDRLDVIKIHKNGIEVNLYEMLDHPAIIQYAKEYMFDENLYEEDEDVVEMLFDDMIINISAGYESLSKHYINAFEMADEMDLKRDEIIDQHTQTVLGMDDKKYVFEFISSQANQEKHCLKWHNFMATNLENPNEVYIFQISQWEKENPYFAVKKMNSEKDIYMGVWYEIDKAAFLNVSEKQLKAIKNYLMEESHKVNEEKDLNTLIKWSQSKMEGTEKDRKEVLGFIFELQKHSKDILKENNEENIMNARFEEGYLQALEDVRYALENENNIVNKTEKDLEM